MKQMQIVQVITWNKGKQNYMRFHLADSLDDAFNFRHKFYQGKIAQHGGYHVIHNNQIKSVESLIKEDTYFKRFKLIK